MTGMKVILLLIVLIAVLIIVFRTRGGETSDIGSFDLTRITPPWESGRNSIFVALKTQIDGGQSDQTINNFTLPDEDIVVGSKGLRWVAGGLEGAFGHHGAAGKESEEAGIMFKSLQRFLADPTKDNLGKLYPLLIEDSALGVVDPLLERIAAEPSMIKSGRLLQFAQWLVHNAPDRGAVKIGVALLGITGSDVDRGDLMLLGRHEEFTLYAAVALMHSAKDPESTLLELGKRVHGWGRIHIVERLAKSEQASIKDWLLREGYKNSVMYEYTAFTCASAGDLKKALSVENPDDQMLLSASEILDTLISGDGGPAEGIRDYTDGAATTLLLLNQLAKHNLTIGQFLTVQAIKQFIENNETKWEELTDKEWTEPLRSKASQLCSEILGRKDWENKVEIALNNDDDMIFQEAIRAAKYVGIDPWELHFKRTQAGKSDWYYLMQTDDPNRIDRVIALAEEKIPLEKIATGVSDSMGMGPEYKNHSALGFVVQDLKRFPRKGWSLIKAALNSPVISNRNMALNALDAWGRSNWDTDTEQLLRTLLSKEPNEKTRELIEKMLNKKSS